MGNSKNNKSILLLLLINKYKSMTIKINEKKHVKMLCHEFDECHLSFIHAFEVLNKTYEYSTKRDFNIGIRWLIEKVVPFLLGIKKRFGLPSEDILYVLRSQIGKIEKTTVLNGEFIFLN